MAATADERTTMTLNPDGVSIAGCKMIYAPKGQAGEYAPLAANPYRGCGTGCAYCYVPLITKQDRKEFDAGAVSRRDYLAQLRKDAQKYRAAGIREQVMFSFTTDVYNPNNRELTRPSIEILIEHGLGFCVLTKGGTRALEDRNLYRRDRDAFASTLTSLDERFAKKWERNAAPPDDRLAALRAFHDAGIFTWVSLEPTLDSDSSLAIVEAAHGFVDLWKVGRVNYLPMTKTTDWRDYTLRMVELLNRLDARHYIKHDLQPYLPPGYPNPMRVPQHH
jgi:DNA repair photolyase